MFSEASKLGRCCVTGANGFIGKSLVSRLEAAGTEVIGLARADVDLRDPDAVRSAFSDFGPQTIFHLAAVGQSNKPGEDAATMRDTLAMAENISRAMDAGTRLIISGSMSEYGKVGVLRESDCCEPRSPYAQAKLAAAMAAADLSKECGFEVCNARLFGVYGPGEAPHRLFPALLAALRSSQPIELSDGEQWRDFVHVNDVCDVLVEIATATTMPQVLNVGTGVALRVRSVIELVADSLGVPHSLLRFGARARSSHDEECIVAHTGQLETLVAVPPQRLVAPLRLELICG